MVGYGIVCTAHGIASLESIAVAPSVRGKGAADALLRSLLRRLRRREIQRLTLMVKIDNHRAIAFYERYGFRRIRRVPGYYEDQMDGILFHLDL